MATYLYVIFFSLVGGVFSLVGGLLLISNKKSAELLARFATPFAAGALLAAALLELLPEALAVSPGSSATRWVLWGMVVFFLLEHFLHWFHHHHEHIDKKMRAPAPLIIIGDTLHNFLDGIAIGAAFLISVPAGIVTAIAVAAHEIPQEIGDFGILLRQGFRRKLVIIINLISALMSTVGAVITFWVGSHNALPIGALLGITAGMFIYIAASDLIPTIHGSFKQKYNYAAVALLLVGILTVSAATEVAHRYMDDTHDHDSSIEHREAEESENHHDHNEEEQHNH